VLLCDLLRYEPKHRIVDLKEFQIDGRNTVLAREDRGDHIVTNESELNEVKAQTTAVFALIIESFSQVLRANEIFAYENFA
jgi:hypothetical protein